MTKLWRHETHPLCHPSVQRHRRPRVDLLDERVANGEHCIMTKAASVRYDMETTTKCCCLNADSNQSLPYLLRGSFAIFAIVISVYGICGKMPCGRRARCCVRVACMLHWLTTPLCGREERNARAVERDLMDRKYVAEASFLLLLFLFLGFCTTACTTAAGNALHFRHHVLQEILRDAAARQCRRMQR
jgi:hypothetical protein